jgi:hypothetical protein
MILLILSSVPSVLGIHERTTIRRLCFPRSSPNLAPNVLYFTNRLPALGLDGLLRYLLPPWKATLLLDHTEAEQALSIRSLTSM